MSSHKKYRIIRATALVRPYLSSHEKQPLAFQQFKSPGLLDERILIQCPKQGKQLFTNLRGFGLWELEMESLLAIFLHLNGHPRIMNITAEENSLISNLLKVKINFFLYCYT